MNAPLRKADVAFSFRMDMRPSEGPPDKEKAHQSATGRPSLANVQQATDKAKIESGDADHNRLLALRAKIRAGDATEQTYAAHNALIDKLRPAADRGWSDHRALMTPAKRAIRNQRQNFEPSFRC